MPSRPKGQQRPTTDEIIDKRILDMVEERGPVSWQELPVGRYTDRAGYLVGEGLLHIVTIDGKAHVAKKLKIETKGCDS